MKLKEGSYENIITNELAMELINEFTPATKTNYLLVDSWYTSAKILLHGLINGYHTIGRIKSNRVIYPAGIKTNVKKFSSYIRSNETSVVTASNNKYYVYRYEGKLPQSRRRKEQRLN